jgi:hypothetical protein
MATDHCCPACLELGEVLAHHVDGTAGHPPCVLPPAMGEPWTLQEDDGAPPTPETPPQASLVHRRFIASPCRGG